MQNHIFISGIDTNCGKTYITGLLAYHLKKAGINCITTKLVQTGCIGISEDIIAHRKTMEIDLLPEDINKSTCPMVYSFPSSPHLAAEIDGLPFKIKKIEKTFSKLKENYDLLITEGAGGLTVPLTSTFLTSDYLKASCLPVFLVSSSRLGSINHTLLSIAFCKSNNINLTTIIYNQFPDDDIQIAKSSFEFLKSYIENKKLSIELIHSTEISKEAFVSKDFIKKSIAKI